MRKLPAPARGRWAVAAVAVAALSLLTGLPASAAQPDAAQPDAAQPGAAGPSAPVADGLARPPAWLGRCVTTHTPVTLPGGAPAQLAGQLCTPAHGRPDTVQFAVHGATYDSDYWDWPQQPATYNYVWKALAAGYAVYDVDRLGTGESSRPTSDQVTETSTVSTLHQVVSALRDGRLRGGYARVEGVGHSFGSYYLTALAATDPGDMDALVLTGTGYTNAPSLHPAPMVPANGVEPWATGLDAGYQVSGSQADRVALLYDPAEASPAVISYDYRDGMDTASTAEFATRPVDLTSLGRQIHVPVLLLDGTHDTHYTLCGGATCATGAALYAAELPHFGTSCLAAATVASGHDVQLSTAAVRADALMLAWSLRTEPPRGTGPARCAATGGLTG